jgi:ABC-2 type transport system permease protein
MGAMLLEMLKMLVIDLLFVGLLVLLLLPLAKYKRAAFAVMKRNFIGYFSNPTGYVFLCIFVLLTSLAAFWPHEFFASNLANLEQLNSMAAADHAGLHTGHHHEHLVGRAAAGNRRAAVDSARHRLRHRDRQVPGGGGDFHGVAAVLAVVHLCRAGVADAGRHGHVGCCLATYFGYWMIGLAMLAIGMVASFLTNNS